MSSPMPRGCGTRISTAIRTNLISIGGGLRADLTDRLHLDAAVAIVDRGGPECSIGAVIQDSF